MDRERKKTFFSFVQPKQYAHTLDMYSNSLDKRNIVCSVSSIQEDLSSSLLLFVMWRQHHNTESIRLLLTTFRFESFNTDYSTAKSVRTFMISVTILLDGRAYIHKCDLSLCSYFMARLFLLVSRHTGNHKFHSNPLSYACVQHYSCCCREFSHNPIIFLFAIAFAFILGIFNKDSTLLFTSMAMASSAALPS